MPRQPNAEGFAQIIVLAGLAILGGIIATLQLQTISAIRAQSALQQTFVGRIAADSATRRIFSAIESEDDPLEVALLNENGTVHLLEAGQDLTLSLEHEGGKISALNPSSELALGYLADLGIVGSLPGDAVEHWASGLRAIVTTGLVELNADATFDQDFSRNHLSTGINPLFASDRVIDAIPSLADWDREGILRHRRTGTIGASSSYFSTKVTALSLVFRSPDLRSTFVLTGGGKVKGLGVVY